MDEGSQNGHFKLIVMVSREMWNSVIERIDHQGLGPGSVNKSNSKSITLPMIKNYQLQPDPNNQLKYQSYLNALMLNPRWCIFVGIIPY